MILAWANGRDSKTQSHVRATIAAMPAGTKLSGLVRVRDRLAEMDLSPGTLNRRIAVLKSAAKFAHRKKWTTRNLSVEVEMLPEPRYIRREVSGDTAQALIRAARTRRAKALVLGAIHTGMRLSELLKFDPSKDIQDGSMRVRKSKNGEDRLIPLPSALEPYLDQFPMTAGWRNVYRSWERTRKRAGVKIRFHDLRHFVGTTLAEANYHPKTIMEIMGHKSMATTMRYTHPSQAVKRQALGAITAKLHQAKKKEPVKSGS